MPMMRIEFMRMARTLRDSPGAGTSPGEGTMRPPSHLEAPATGVLRHVARAPWRDAPICHKGQEGSELGRASAGIRAAATAVVRQELAGSGMAAIKRAQASLGNGSFTQRLARGRDTGPGNGAAAASGTERLLAQAEKTQMGVANDHGSTPSLASECARMQQRPVDPDQTKLRPIAPRVQGHDAPLRAATAVARRDP